jgi:NAD(P)-dependent dehydrogenase (short-subunit alcohol dehydrogenase family)
MRKFAMATGNNPGIMQDKVLFVAGVGPLMGQGVARVAAREGAKVAIAARTQATIDALADEINAEGGTALAVRCDLAEESQLKAAIDRTNVELGTITSVFYNAAFYDHEHDTLELDPTVWKTTMDVNLYGAMNTARFTIPGMIENGSGSFVFNSSAAAQYAEGFRLGYSVSKAALDAVVRHIAKRYGHDGIRANSIYPFVIPPDVPEDLVKDVIALTCLGRSGTAEEIGNAVTFLLSDRASYITGEGLHLEGGMFARAHWPEMT